MEITNRFILSNNDVGVVINDDGVEYTSLVRGLYDETLLHGLIDSGYKIYDYNGNIVSPKGISISELPECEAEFADYEIQMMYDACDYVLTEEQAAQFFIREVNSIVNFLEPVEIVIHTREELLRYIDENYYYYNSHDIRDVRPLNAITAREALFDIQELAADKELCNKFTIMLKNRMMLNINEWESLMQFFTEVSGGAVDFTSGEVEQSDILQAYMAWGLSGIKTPVVELGAIKFESTNIYSDDDSEIRISEICYLDNTGAIHFSGGVIKDISEFDYSDLQAQPVIKDYHGLMNKVSTWKSEGVPIRCLVNKPEPRFKMSLVDSSGVSYTARISHKATVVKDLHGVVFSHPMFSVIDAYDMPVSIEYIHNRDSYAIFNLIKAQAYSLIRNKVVRHKYKSTYEMCLAEGLSPEGALKYITSRISSDYGINSEIGSPNDMLGIDEVFRYIKPEYITKYNPAQLDYDNVFELIDIMRQVFDESLDDDSTIVTASELRERPIERLCFAKSILTSNLVVDDARLGRAEDVGISVSNTIVMLYAIAKYALGDVDFDSLVSLFQSDRLYELISVDDVFSIKDSEYNGMDKDIARLRKSMAEESGQLIYVTRVYREMSNDEPSKQRHYMFECLEFDASSKGAAALLDSISYSVKEALDTLPDIDRHQLELLKMQSEYVAARLLFKLVLDNTATSTVEVPIGEYTVNVVVKDNVYKRLHYDKEYISLKFSTLCDFSMYDVAQNGNICIFCVNANITPWYVTPKHGYTIPEYNFTLNFILNSVLDTFSEGYRNSVASAKAKVRQISNQFGGNSLYKYDLSAFIGVDYTLDTIDTVLNHANDELPSEYYKRFMLHHNNAQSNGKYLRSMRLKSDTTFANYSTVCYSNYLESDIYDDLSDGNNKRILMYIDVVDLKERVSIEDTAMTKTNVKPFNLEDENMSDILRWLDIITGTAVFKAFVLYGGSALLFITVDGQTRMMLSELTVSKCIELAAQGFMYQLSANRFLLCTGFGYLSLEVW